MAEGEAQSRLEAAAVHLKLRTLDSIKDEMDTIISNAARFEGSPKDGNRLLELQDELARRKRNRENSTKKRLLK